MPGGARGHHIGLDRSVAGAGAALEDARAHQQLGAVADGGDGFAGGVEFTHDLQHALVEAQILGSAPAGHHQTGVVGHIDLVEVIVDSEVVAALLAVGLVALEVMDGRAHEITGLLAGADGVDFVAQHQQHLERHHHFIIFHIIAGQQQNLFHRILLCGKAPVRNKEAGPALAIAHILLI